MSGTWDSHLSMVNGLIAQQRAQRTARGEAAATSRQAAPVPPMPGPAPDMFGGEPWQGGANGGIEAGQAGRGGGWAGGFPNASTIASSLDINPAAARAAMSALGLLSGPLGMGISAINSIGNVANTTSNVGMLNDLNVNPGMTSTLGGLLGFNGLAGNHTSALNAAMGNQYSGFSNLSSPQMPGDITGLGGFSDALSGLGPTSENAPLGAVETSPMENPGDLSGAKDGGTDGMDGGGGATGGTGGMGGGGTDGGGTGGMGGQEGWQQGGYTGAGRDGVVQPSRRAGVVHEGEYVIPAHMVRRMGLLSR